jgi:GTPase SAR1 family protein
MSTLQAHKTLKLVVCGGRGTGKTSIIRRLQSNAFEADTPKTVGPMPTSMRFTSKNHGEVMLTIWEIAGAQSGTSAMYFRGCLGALFVVEQGDASTMDGIEKQLALFRQVAQLPAGCMALCVAKVDRRRKHKDMEELLAQIADRDGIRLYDLSAQTGQGVEEVFADVVEAALETAAERQREDEAAQRDHPAGVPSASGSPAASPMRSSGAGRRSVPKNSIVREPIPFDEAEAEQRSAEGGKATSAPAAEGSKEGTGPEEEAPPVMKMENKDGQQEPDVVDADPQHPSGCMKCIVM